MKIGDVVVCPEPKCKRHFKIREDLVIGGRLDRYLRCPYCSQVHSFFIYQCITESEKRNGKIT